MSTELPGVRYNTQSLEYGAGHVCQGRALSMDPQTDRTQTIPLSSHVLKKSGDLPLEAPAVGELGEIPSSARELG